MLFPTIRRELQKLHGILKQGETAAEEIAHERLAVLHDNLHRLEAKIAVIPVEALQELKGVGSELTQKIVTECLAFAAKRAEENAQAEAKNKQQAAAAALAVPEPKAAPFVPPAEAPVGPS